MTQVTLVSGVCNFCQCETVKLTLHICPGRLCVCSDILTGIQMTRVYLGSLLRVHLAAIHQDYLKRDRHVPHTRLYLLQREGEKRKTCYECAVLA